MQVPTGISCAKICTDMSKRVLTVGLLLVCAFAMVHHAWAGMTATKMRSGFDQKVTELMILAQQARAAGDMPNAELFWMHARELRPSLPRPSWLDIKPVPVQEPVPPTEDEILARIATLPYLQAKQLLEERLQKNPANNKVRQLFLDLAIQQGDHVEVARHQSILSGKTSGSSLLYVWYLVAAMLAGLLVWQLTGIYRDLTEH